MENDILTPLIDTSPELDRNLPTNEIIEPTIQEQQNQIKSLTAEDKFEKWTKHAFKMAKQNKLAQIKKYRNKIKSIQKVSKKRNRIVKIK